jgi:hypothetical protein
MATEDFSFPTTGDTFPPCSIDSPPLWRLSPAASPNSSHEEPPNGAAKGEDHRNDEEDCFATGQIKCSQRKSFSSVEGCRRVANDDDDDDDDDEEDKMDMLWEDFNEELSRNSSTSRSNTSSSRDIVELGCGKALTASKTHGTTLTTRKPGMVVIMKVLKKLFLMQNSHRKLKIKG